MTAAKRIAAVLAAALALAGCATPAGADEPRLWRAVEGDRYQATDYAVVPLPDGRRVECLRYTSSVGGGLSCNWGGAK